MCLGDSDPEEALQHLRDAHSSLYEAPKALFDGDFEKYKAPVEPIAGEQPYFDEQIGVNVLKEQTSEVIKALRRRSADRPDEYLHGEIGELLELAREEQDEE